jgi:hypothetical protein
METLSAGSVQPDGIFCWIGCTGSCTIACLTDLVSPVMDIVSYSAASATFFYF